MVTTRAKSTRIEPPARDPVVAPKRKRAAGIASASSAAQPPAQPSSKRRKTGKALEQADVPSISAGPVSAAPAVPAKKPRLSKKERLAEHWARKQRGEYKGTVAQSASSSIEVDGSKQSAPVDLTHDNYSSEDDAKRPRSALTQDAEDDDSDSRYALSSKRKGRTKKSAVPAARRTAELQFEEDGLEEVDKAEVVVASAANRASTQTNRTEPIPPAAVKDDVTHNIDTIQESQVNNEGIDKTKRRKDVPSLGTPAKIVMFTVIEAIQTLSLYQEGTMSVPADIDPQSLQPYNPIETGERLSYPVKGTYHLGALGRYGFNSLPPLPFSLTVPLSEHSFIPQSPHATATSPTRHGLGFHAVTSTRPRTATTRRPNNYCFTFGRYKGRRMDSVPIEYLRSIRDGDDYYRDEKLQQAFKDLYPKGLYESEAESYTFEKGGFKGKRLDEVPKTYLWSLLRKAKADQLPKKGKGRLERALELWEKQQLDLTRD